MWFSGMKLSVDVEIVILHPRLSRYSTEYSILLKIWVIVLSYTISSQIYLYIRLLIPTLAGAEVNIRITCRILGWQFYRTTQELCAVYGSSPIHQRMHIGEKPRNSDNTLPGTRPYIPSTRECSRLYLQRHAEGEGHLWLWGLRFCMSQLE